MATAGGAGVGLVPGCATERPGAGAERGELAVGAGGGVGTGVADW